MRTLYVTLVLAVSWFAISLYFWLTADKFFSNLIIASPLIGVTTVLLIQRHRAAKLAA